MKLTPPCTFLLCVALILLVHLLVPGRTALGFPWRALGIVPLVQAMWEVWQRSGVALDGRG